MINIPKIPEKIYTLEEIITILGMKTIWRAFAYAIKVEYLATEVITDRPEMVIPDVARIFRTELFVSPTTGNYVDYEKLVEDCGGYDNFKGTGYHKSILIKEYWEDCGDDGHILNELTGYKITEGLS